MSTRSVACRVGYMQSRAMWARWRQCDPRSVTPSAVRHQRHRRALGWGQRMTAALGGHGHEVSSTVLLRVLLCVLGENVLPASFDCLARSRWDLAESDACVSR